MKDRLKFGAALIAASAIAGCGAQSPTEKSTIDKVTGRDPGVKVLKEEIRTGTAYQGRAIVDFTVIPQNDDAKVELINNDGLTAYTHGKEDIGWGSLKPSDNIPHSLLTEGQVIKGADIYKTGDGLLNSGYELVFDCDQLTSPLIELETKRYHEQVRGNSGLCHLPYNKDFIVISDIPTPSTS